jgi:hypothetical protein
MKSIDIDGSRWTSPLEFFNGLKDALGGFDGHGLGFDAFIDTMVYHHELLTVQPPYVVRIHHPHPQIEPTVKELARYVVEAREWRKTNWGDDADVAICIADSD